VAATESKMLPLGTPLPAFSLPDFDDKIVAHTDFKNSPGLVVAFICNHCPFVRHVRSEFARFAKECRTKDIAVIAIAANDSDAYPQDGPEGMRGEALEVGYDFPYLFDATQSVANAFDAACTPDFYLFDGRQRLYYRGQFDESRPGNKIPTTGSDLRAACEDLLAGRPPRADQKPSVGCSIKWRS
jgi:peroxiredoxin